MLNLEGSANPTIGGKDELAGRVYVPLENLVNLFTVSNVTRTQFTTPFHNGDAECRNVTSVATLVSTY